MLTDPPPPSRSRLDTPLRAGPTAAAVLYPPMSSQGREIFVVSGEPSGDTHTAHLVRSLKALDPDLAFRGYGGAGMARAGVDLLHDLAGEAIMGLFPVIAALPGIVRLMGRAERELRERRPAALLLTDYPGFNIRLAARARKLGVPVIYYISPQVWAWGRRRVGKLARLVDLMLVILPFEEEIYRKSGLRTEYVGHPLLDHLGSHAMDREAVERLRAFRQGPGPLLGLFPGSRRHVMETLLPDFLGAAERLASMPGMAGLRCVVAAAQPAFAEYIQRRLRGSVPVLTVCGKPYEAMEAMDLGLTTSGTTTLEIAAFQKPFVLAYRVSPVTYGLGRLLVSVDHIGLVNLVFGDRLVPEHVGTRPVAAGCAADLHRLWTDEAARAEQISGLAEVRRRLDSRGSYDRAARLIVDFLDQGAGGGPSRPGSPSTRERGDRTPPLH